MSYRRTLSIVLTLLGTTMFTASSASATTLITDCAGLQAIVDNLSENYELANNINCEETWSEGFTQIGDFAEPFTGTLDGKGFVIDDPMIDGISDYAGLFSVTGSTAVIKNLGVTRAAITGSSYTSILVGYNQGTIQEVFTEGTVTNIDSSYAGGLVGINSGGDIINSYSHAAVSVVSGNYGGGLVGYQDTQGTITNSYSTGELSGANPGGLIGYNMSGTITDSFWDTTTSGDSTSYGGTGKSTADMTTATTFTDTDTTGLETPWDFVGDPNDDTATDNIWAIDTTNNSNYPYLQWEVPTITDVNSDTANGIYGVNSVIDIDVTFSETVTSTDDVTVTLETGATDRTCTFTVTSATSGTCNYTVQAGDAVDNLTVNSITGTIQDANLNTLTNTTPLTDLADNKTLIIETTVPTVTLSNNRVDNGGTTSKREMTFIAEFDETVSGFTVDDIVISNATIDEFTETVVDTRYTFVLHPTDSGQVTVDIPADAVQDSAGNNNLAATQYVFTYERIPLVESVDVNKGTITIVYDNGETVTYTPFEDNYIHHYIISEDGTKVGVVGSGKFKLYSIAGVVSVKKIGGTDLRKSETKVKIKQLYSNYETVVVLTPGKMLVWRLTDDGELKKKAKVTYESTGTLPDINFKKKKKHIKLKFDNAEKLTWKLKSNGKLKAVE